MKKEKKDKTLPLQYDFNLVKINNIPFSKHVKCSIYRTDMYKVFPLYKPIIRIL